MKRLILFFTLCLMVTICTFAQEIVPVAEPDTTFVLDLTTFTGIVTLVSFLVTQITKVIPAVAAANKLAKIGISCAVGIIVCMIAWLLHLTPLLTEYIWWQVLIYGLVVGLSGCGFYNLVKAVGELFKKKE